MIIGERTDLKLPVLWTCSDLDLLRWYDGWPTIDEAVSAHAEEREKYAPKLVTVYEIKRCSCCGVYQPSGIEKLINFAEWKQSKLEAKP